MAQSGPSTGANQEAEVVVILFRSSDEAEEANAARRLKRFRSRLIVYYFLLWALGLLWWKLGGWLHATDVFSAFPFGGFMAASPLALVWLATITAPCVLLAHLFSLAVMGVLYRLHVKLGIIYIVTPILGLLLTYGFLELCYDLMYGS